jgi:hypothetical protein
MWGYQTQNISPDELVTGVSEAVEAALRNYGALPEGPKSCSDAEGYSRASVEIPLPRTLADQLMNGATGYRAHYSISVDAGESFSRKLVDAVALLIIDAEELYKDKFDRQFCTSSLLGPFSKIWYPKQISDPAATEYLLTFKEKIKHRRWVDHWKGLPQPRKGLLAPISDPPSILLNGTFVNDDGQVYEQKPGRSQQLFESGWT